MIVLGPAGDVVIELGEPRQPMFPRSSNKPLQAVGMLRCGLEVPAEHLALAAASHSGEERHVERVRDMLAAGGLDEDDLACPASWPLGEAARDAWIAAGRPQQRICMNCSGKHAAMLLTCQVNGWDIAGYRDPDHPLQRALRTTVEDLAAETVAAVGVDGCGAPLFGLTLTGVARAFGRVASAAGGPERAVADAMRAHPDLVGGSGRTATLLMAGIPGLIAKDGAEGVFAAALPDGSAVAVKIDDGAPRAADRAVVAGLRRLGGCAPVLDDLATAPVLGGDAQVGTIHFREGLL
jgi:L-asparaginase II